MLKREGDLLVLATALTAQTVLHEDVFIRDLLVVCLFFHL